MQDVRIFSSAAWELSLPDDWVQKDFTEHGAVCLELLDGSKALYLTTWTLGDGESRTPADIAASFKGTEARALQDMEGYSWSVCADRTNESQAMAVVVTDYLAAANSYRIITKILVRPPVVVRASFHDYLCDNYDTSREYFASILDSLNLV